MTTDSGEQSEGTPPEGETSAAAGDSGTPTIPVEERLRRAESSAESFRKRAKQLEGELAKLTAANQSETERAIAAAKDEGYAKASAEFAQRLATAELRAMASGVLADPEDAARFLDLSELMREDGALDQAAAKSALTGLVGSKPYLAVAAGQRTNGSADQGVRPDGGASGRPDMETLLRSAVRGH